MVVFHANKMCLVRRSADVTSDSGLWHCVTGYLENDTSPLDQGLAELEEELGIRCAESEVFSTSLIHINEWTIHVFGIEASHPDVLLNWENDDFHWIEPRQLVDYSIVWWLRDVLERVEKNPKLARLDLGHSTTR